MAGCKGNDNMNKRQTEILRILCKNRNFMTIGDIAELAGVSPNTVRSDLSVIKEELKSADAGSLESKPHIGVKLISTDEKIKKLENNSNNIDKEIVFFILRQLFKNDTLTAQKLSERYFLSRTLTENVLSYTEKWLSKNNIVFERKRGKGISIKYSEFNYQTAFNEFFTKYKDMYFGLVAERESFYPIITGRDYTSICAALDGFDISQILKAIYELEKEFGYKYNYLSSVKLSFMLSLFIIRKRKGKEIQPPKPSKTMSDGKMDSETTKVLSKKLSEYLKITISANDEKYIEFLLATSEIQEFETEEKRHCTEVMETELCRLTVKVVNLISEVTISELKFDKYFIRNMFLQLKVTVSRLKYGVVSENPLLSEIKQKYSNMMAAAWLVGNIFENELGLEINENEAGYIAILTGGAIERHMAKLSAAIVCDYGVGISGILTEKLRRIIPELWVDGVYSVRDVRKLKSGQFDFIISAAELQSYNIPKEIVYVSNLLSDDDVKKIADEMKKIRNKKKKDLKAIGNTVKLYSSDLIFPKLNVKSKEELLKKLCSRLEMLGYVTEQFEKSVFEREKTMSTGIGNMTAIPHGLSEYVNRSVFAYASLENAIDWNGNGEMVDAVFLLAFDLSKNSSVKDEILGFYKSIVNFMEDTDKLKTLREFNDKDDIVNMFNLWREG